MGSNVAQRFGSKNRKNGMIFVDGGDKIPILSLLSLLPKFLRRLERGGKGRQITDKGPHLGLDSEATNEKECCENKVINLK